MYVPKLTSNADFKGAWDPATATLDWCESNYVWSFYIAEWWNTISNLVMIFFGFHGALSVYRNGGERRFICSFLCLAGVGLGSWLFHMTLTYPMQLVDELSMLYTTSTLIYCALEIKSGWTAANYPLAVGLVLMTSLACASYVIIGHPVFHQVVYILMVVVLVVQSIRILREYPRHKHLFAVGLAMFTLGMIVWKVDVHYCHGLRELRASRVTKVLPPALFELHAWWHVLAGFGTYMLIIILAATRSDIVRSEPRLDVRFVLRCIPLLVAKSAS